MKPLAIFRHAPGEGPGYLSEYLRRREIPYTLICVDQGDPIPKDPRGYAGFVFMGGPMSVNDPLPWIPEALGLIRAAQEDGQPILGHCLGGQLISKALGGQVGPNSVPEVGWGQVTAIINDASRPWLQDLPPVFEVFHWHNDTFTIPKGASHILKSPFCSHQGFVLGRTLALQCHIEMTPTMIESWIKSPQGQQLKAGASVQTPEAMRADANERLARLHKTADTLYGKWLETLCE